MCERAPWSIGPPVPDLERKLLDAGSRGGVRAPPTLRRVGRSLIERRLRDVSDRLKVAARDLDVAEEQLAHLADTADEARLRALVSETPIAGQEHREAEAHAEAMRRHRDDLRAEVRRLEALQDELLDRLVAART